VPSSDDNPPPYNDFRSPGSLRVFAVAVGLALALLFAVTAAVVTVYLLRDRPPAAPVAQDDTEQKDAERKRLEAERKALEDQRSQLNLETKRWQFKDLLTRAQAELDKKHYAEAEKLYTDALKLFPSDPEALRGLIVAGSAVTSAGKPGEDKEKTKTEFDRLVAQGKEALAAKKPAEAVRAFEAALLLLPGEAAAAMGLADARAALAKDEGEKQRLVDYQAHMDAGKAALVAQRFTDAQREFIAAQRVIPGDAAAIKGQRQAEDGLNDIQDREKRMAAFKDQLDRARAALRDRRFDEAVATADQALRLFPNDQEATQVQREAKQARLDARTQYDGLMTRADAALQLQRFEEATRLYEEALRLFPGDAAAARGARQAAQVALDLAAGQAAYNRFMDAGGLALRNRRFGDAVTAFSEALRLVPNDVAAARGLREAQEGVERELRRAQDLDRNLRAGNDALKARRFADAIRAFNDALRIDRDNAQARDGLSQAKYGQAIADGQAALAAKRFDDAIKNFEAALREVPNDPTATAGLRQAQAMKKPDKPDKKGPNP
jgi:tetratricopeptide (TPR) repeat protein